MAGYSGTPLIKKLGIKPGMKIHIIQAPDNYFNLLGEYPENANLSNRFSPETDFIHIFAGSRKAFDTFFPKAIKSIRKDGAIWVSWPKKASGIKTDLTEDIIRDIALRAGLVDVKVCAVDEIWSGLKIVYRVKDRK
ncbi:MAG: hypothetical protein FD123_4359 [Bacteroidetes bacterium]|nr:MAG: hypothetical protein FD123_4359 [Bacteroidota bacterium]